MAYKSTLSSENIQEALDIIHSAVVIGGGILTLDNQSSSEQISSAIGGEDGFNRILERIRGGNIALGIKVDDTTDNGIIMASIVAPKAENKFTISYLYKGIHYSDEFSLSGSTFSLSQTTEGGGLDSIFQDIQTDSALLESGAVYPIYLTNEKYSEIADAVKNDKIIRLIFACGVFYSVSVLLQPSTASTFVSKIIFGRAFMTGDDLNNFIEAKGKSYTVTFSENNDEGHDEPIKAIVTTEPDINKEIIEEVFTGNVTTHTHDSTYIAAELETDVWDGTSVSSSLSGSGAEEDPYLIQSCADFAYLISGNSSFGTSGASFEAKEFTYFKFTKNLDFGHKPVSINLAINALEGGWIIMGDYDGNGITILNFTSPTFTEDNTTIPVGVFPNFYCGRIHGFNFKDLNITFDLDEIKTNDASSLSMYCILVPLVPMYFSIYDISINGTITLNGNISHLVDDSGMFGINLIPTTSYFEIMINSEELDESLISPKYPCVLDINIVDNTIKNGGKVAVSINCMYDLLTKNIVVSTPLTATTLSDNVTFDGDFGILLTALWYGDSVYLNSTGDTSYYSGDIDSESSTKKAGIPKTLNEMKSEEFVNLLNSELPEAKLTKNPDGGLPKIASLIPEFDGYVRKSVFDQEVSGLKNKVKEFVPVVYISEDIANTTNKSSQPASIYTDFINVCSNLSAGKVLFKGVYTDEFCITFVSALTNNITVKFIYDDKLYKCISTPDSSGNTWSMTVTSVQIGGSSGGVTADQVLTKTNITAYTPTQNYHPATKKYVDDNSVSSSEVLTKTNTTSYTPTSDYHPATKRFVEDQISNINIPIPSSIPYVERLNDIDEVFAEKAIKAGSFVCGFLNAPTDTDIGDGAGVNREMYNVLFILDFSDSDKHNKDEMTQTQYTSSVFKFVYDSSYDKTYRASKCEFYIDVYGIGVNTWHIQYADIHIDDDGDARLLGGEIKVSAETPKREDSELTTVDDCYSDLLRLSKENWSRYISRSFAKNSLYVVYNYQLPTNPLYSMYMKVDYLTCDQSGWVKKIGFTRRNDKYEIVLESNNTFSISKIN